MNVKCSGCGEWRMTATDRCGGFLNVISLSPGPNLLDMLRSNNAILAQETQTLWSSTLIEFDQLAKVGDRSSMNSRSCSAWSPAIRQLLQWSNTNFQRGGSGSEKGVAEWPASCIASTDHLLAKRGVLPGPWCGNWCNQYNEPKGVGRGIEQGSCLYTNDGSLATGQPWEGNTKAKVPYLFRNDACLGDMHGISSPRGIYCTRKPTASSDYVILGEVTWARPDVRPCLEAAAQPAASWNTSRGKGDKSAMSCYRADPAPSARVKWRFEQESSICGVLVCSA